MKILLAVSNYNEEALIGKVLDDLRAHLGLAADVVVIDNASTDRSPEIARARGFRCAIHPVNTGGGAGVIKTAFLLAYEGSYDVYCHMDADFQHRAEDVAGIVSRLTAGPEPRPNAVFASRFLLGEGFQSFFLRRLGIHLFSRVVSAMTGYAVTDITNGLRAYDRRAIEFFATQCRFRYEVCVELLLLARGAGLRYAEAPAVLRPRRAGRSEISLKSAITFPLYATVSVLGWCLSRALGVLSHAKRV